MSRRYNTPRVRRGLMNTLVIRVYDREERALELYDFKETVDGVIYEDSSGYSIPIKYITVESEKGTFPVKTIKKTKLSKITCNILGETDNFYIVRGEVGA